MVDTRQNWRQDKKQETGQWRQDSGTGDRRLCTKMGLGNRG